MKSLYIFVLIFLLSFQLPGQDVQFRYFEIAFRGKPDSINVYAATSDADLLAVIDQELRRPEWKRQFHISGLIERGTRYNNYRYNWHFVPNQWKLTAEPGGVVNLDPRHADDQLFEILGSESLYSPAGSYVKREVTAEQVRQSVSEESIKVYPNPVAQKLFIQLDNFPHRVRQVVLYGPQGRMVKIKEPAPELPGTLQFSVERLQGGYYTLSVRTEYGRWAEKILVR